MISSSFAFSSINKKRQANRPIKSKYCNSNGFKKSICFKGNDITKTSSFFDKIKSFFNFFINLILGKSEDHSKESTTTNHTTNHNTNNYPPSVSINSGINKSKIAKGSTVNNFPVIGRLE